jgi:hypothetical protein
MQAADVLPIDKGLAGILEISELKSSGRWDFQNNKRKREVLYGIRDSDE